MRCETGGKSRRSGTRRKMKIQKEGDCCATESAAPKVRGRDGKGKVTVREQSINQLNEINQPIKLIELFRLGQQKETNQWRYVQRTCESFFFRFRIRSIERFKIQDSRLGRTKRSRPARTVEPRRKADQSENDVTNVKKVPSCVRMIDRKSVTIKREMTFRSSFQRKELGREESSGNGNRSKRFDEIEWALNVFELLD